MLRKNFIRTGLLTTGGLVLAQQNLLAALFQQAPYKIKMLNHNTGIFTEKGGTILFVLDKSGIIVVDAQFPEQSQHLIDALRKKSDEPFQVLINTHHHADHTAGNISFKSLTKNVLAHNNSLNNQKEVAKQQHTEDKQLYPNQTYTGVWRQGDIKNPFALYYYGPGHTNGDSLVHFEDSNIVHMGDLVFNRRHPFVDRSAGASISNWIKVLDQAMSKFSKKTTFVFGHAADGYEVTGTKDDLKAFQTYLTNVLTYTQSQIKAGRSKEDIIRVDSIPGSPEWRGDGIERPLGAAYDELTNTM